MIFRSLDVGFPSKCYDIACLHSPHQADGATPVYIAAFKGHIEALKLLVAARADVDRSTEDRVTWPLIEGCQISIEA